MSSSWKSRTTKTIVPTWRPKNFCGSAQPVGKLTNICGTACTMAGYRTVHDSSCDELSRGFRRTCISVANTAMRMRSRDATFFERGHLPIEVCLTLSTATVGRSNRLEPIVFLIRRLTRSALKLIFLATVRRISSSSRCGCESTTPIVSGARR